MQMTIVEKENLGKIKNYTKAERYDWVKPGDSGRQCRIKIEELKVDHTYQRQEVSQFNTIAIARDFSWVAFGSVVVMERPNGDKYIADGQQRVLAAKRRGDINEVPCVLFRSDGREHEARAFISLNVRRATVPAVAKFRAAVSASLSPEKQISEWFRQNGFEITENGKRENGIDFPTIIVKCWKTDDESTREALLVQREINGNDPMCCSVHKGLWWLIHNNVKVREHADKLKRQGGRIAMIRAIKAYRIETNETEGERQCGLAILREINRKKRIKIPSPRTE